MEINKSGAKYSAIVGIGEKLKELSRENGEEYLYLNRGINQVVNIDLKNIIKLIDFNVNQLQYYPPSTGMFNLKNAINKVYFQKQTTNDNIFITAGGTHALSLIFNILNVDKVYTSSFFWGAYHNILKISNKKQCFYSGYNDLQDNPEKYKNSVLIICDPNNPIGDKYDDNELLQIVDLLTKQNVTIIWDSPYRRMFFDDDDTFYQKLLKYDNVIITESFSKSVGLSGQRLGFAHTQNEKLKQELRISLLYSGNGINAFAQTVVELLLTTTEGKKAVRDFKSKTVADIKANIEYLRKNNLLAKEFYKTSIPIGIFVIVNKSYEELLKYRIGSVPLNYFTKINEFETSNFARICVSAKTDKFKLFFDKMLMS